MGPGYQALRENAAWLDLSSRGRIFASGEDRQRLLHAMTTNQVKELLPGQGCYAFFLNPQGRILADANLFVLPDRILIDVEPEVRESLYQHLDKFIIADDVTLEDASESLTAIGVEGPKAEEVLAAMGAPIPEAPYSHVDWNGRIVARVNATGEPGFRIFGEKLTHIPADAESVRIVRLEHAKPRYGEDIFETTLPQETQQKHALNFSKGCYIGQEIVERIRARAILHRTFTGFVLEGEPPQPRTKVTDSDKNIGEITSAACAPFPGGERTVALGYLRREFEAPGTAVQVGEQKATVQSIPFQF